MEGRGKGRREGTNFLPLLTEEVVQRLREKVQPIPGSGGCRECISQPGQKRPKVHLGKRSEYMARVWYVMKTGREIPPGCEVHHTCGNTRCMEHLSLEVDHQVHLDEHHRVLSEQGFLDRIRALRRGDPVQPIPLDAQVDLLGRVFRRASKYRGWPAAELGTAEKNTLKRLLESAADEAEAYLALRAVVLDWAGYKLFAENEYGFWEKERLPKRALLSAVSGTDGVSAMLGFWRSTPEFHERAEWRRYFGPGYWGIREDEVAARGCTGKCPTDITQCCVTVLRKLGRWLEQDDRTDKPERAR
jgi:hypothetical protein